MSKMAEAEKFTTTRRRFFAPNPFDYDAFDNLLGRIQDEFDTRACIAGGWIRDAGLFLARPRDIDVFLEYDEEKHQEFFKRVEATPSRLHGEPNPDYNWAGNLEFQTVRQMEFADEQWPVNLIFLKPEATITGKPGFWVDHVIRTFDMGLSQVGYCTNRGMRCTLAFDEAVRFQEITLNPLVPHYRVAERVAKIAAKYPTFILPTEAAIRAATETE